MNRENQRWWDWPAALILMVLLEIIVLRLQATKWTDNLGIVEVLTFVGGLLGLLMGRSFFRKRWVWLFAAILSLYMVPWQLGTTLDYRYNWLERLWVLGDRLGRSVWMFVNNEPISDPLLFLLVISLAFWFTAVTAAYLLVRYGKPWVPVGIGTLVMGLIEFYHPGFTRSDLYMGAFVVFAVALIGRMYYLNSQRLWSLSGYTIDEGVGFELTRGAVVAGLSLVLIAWNLPILISTIATADSSSLTRSWETLRGRISNLFAGLQGQYVTEVSSFGSEMALGTGSPLNNVPVFRVDVDVAPPQGSRYYWRGRVYDVYQDGIWRSTPGLMRQMPAWDDSFANPAWSGYQPISVQVTPYLPLVNTLYVPGLPKGISRPTRLFYHDSGGNKQTDIISLVVEAPVPVGEAYRANTIVVAPTVRLLRGSGREYPSWVVERYLQLPDHLPRRIRDLAGKIAADANTPYDQVVAVTHYLRSNYQYQPVVSAPPPDYDPLDWFLFEDRQGFCNYYATAEVILLRYLGIPARLAVGYAQGEADPEKPAYLVRQADSHAWPEVYFVGVGWVEFEPTAAFPPREIPEGEPRSATNGDYAGLAGLWDIDPDRRRLGEERAESLLEADVPVDQPPEPQRLSWGQIVLIAAGGMVILLGLLGYLWRSRQPDVAFAFLLENTLEQRKIPIPRALRNWLHRQQLSPLENTFNNSMKLIQLFGKNVHPSQTPAEQVNIFLAVLPETSRPVAVLLEEYQRAMYSPYPADVKRFYAAARRIRSQAYRAWLRRKFG